MTIVIIIILAAAGWAWCGPAGTIAVLAGGGALAPRQAAARAVGTFQ